MKLDRRETASAIIFSALAAWIFSMSPLASQISNPGTPTSGTPANNDCAKFVVSGGNVQSITTAGAGCASQSAGANPTATAGPTPNNGAATTFMRSDASPPVQKGSSAQFGLMECDNSTVTCPGGVLSGVAPANPTATATTTANNGVASTFMRSDASPAVGVTTFGGQTAGPGQSAVMQGTGAKIQASTGTTTTNDCVKFDVNGNTVDNGAVCGGASGANPTATASNVAVNGVATTFMRSDAASAVQLGSNAQLGLAEGDGTSVTLVSGVATSIAASKAQQQTGTDNNVNVKPAHQQDHDSAVKAWATWVSGGVALSYNVTSITAVSTGVYDVAFSTAFSGANNYWCAPTATPGLITGSVSGSKTASNFRVDVRTGAGVNTNSDFGIVCYGRQ